MKTTKINLTAKQMEKVKTLRFQLEQCLIRSQRIRLWERINTILEGREIRFNWLGYNFQQALLNLDFTVDYNDYFTDYYA